MQYTAFLAYALGIPVYDAQTLCGILIVILTALIFFVLLEEYDPRLAYLALPLYVFLFTFPFVSGLVFGVLPAIFGFLFLFATLFMLFHMGIRHSSIPLGIFLSAMVMGHTVRALELFFFGGAFFVCAFLLKKIDLGFVKKVIISGLLSLILSLYYLVMFWHRFSEDRSSSLDYVPQNAARYLLINLGDFGLIQYVILAGLVLCLYFLIKERKKIASLIFIFPILSFLLVFFLRINRMYQVTFFWPVFLSLAFGLVLFFITSQKWFFPINKHLAVYLVISLCLSLFFVYEYYYSFSEPVLKNIASGGPLPVQEQWDNLIWISKNTPSNATVLFFYLTNSDEGDIYPFFVSKRLSFFVPLNELDEAINQSNVAYNYGVSDTSVSFFYKRGDNTPFKIIKLNKSEYTKQWTVCDFDYIYGKRAIRLYDFEGETKVPVQIEKRVLYTIKFINTLLKNKNFSIVFQNDEAYILKNNNPGGDCV